MEVCLSGRCQTYVLLCSNLAWQEMSRRAPIEHVCLCWLRKIRVFAAAQQIGGGCCMSALGPGWSSTSLLQSSAQQYRQCKNNPFFINKGLVPWCCCASINTMRKWPIEIVHGLNQSNLLEVIDKKTGRRERWLQNVVFFRGQDKTFTNYVNKRRGVGSPKMLSFCQCSYHRKCQPREVPMSKKAKNFST